MDKKLVAAVNTPCYVVVEELLKKNLECLKSVIDQTGCKILLAQKAYSMYASYPLIGQYLSGTTASSLFEARLGAEEMGGETHIYAPAYREDQFDEILELCDHIVFNSPSQWDKYIEKVRSCGKSIQCGIRINPQYSEIETDIYNPCFEYSRLGTVKDQLSEELLNQVDGIHFHTMCEQNSDTLERTLTVIEEQFGAWLPRLEWIDFGGGHHITRPDYDLERLIKCINHFKESYDLEVYLEPGEAIALNAGFLVSEVLETMENGMRLAIMDSSAACHMPDVIEMPYRPQIINSGEPGQYPYTYRLGGPTCLAGDIIGDYSFNHPLEPKERLVFCDMAIYSMVKNNTFNGVNLPAIYFAKEDGSLNLIKQFGYEDFKRRL